MRLWKIAAGVVVLTMVFAGTAGTASAHGSYSSSYVDGGGTLTDDWSENFEDIGNSLCNGCGNSWNTDVVHMWQAILVSEGFLSESGVDGKFGPGTAAATRKWQARYDLKADGWVGDDTWNKADDRLRWRDSGGSVVYLGREGKVWFHRGGHYQSYDGGAYSTWRVTLMSGDDFSLPWAYDHIYYD